MDNCLVDRETLGQFVDSLINTKFPNQPTSDFGKLREDAIRVLDERISNSIFGGLSEPQLIELNQLLDDENTDESAFADFFMKSGVNLEQSITGVFNDFKREFLGGENA